MYLSVEELPPKPNRDEIGAKDEASPYVERKRPEDPSRAALLDILSKHAKTPTWGAPGEKITITCNFHHEFQLTATEIMEEKVRCPACRVNIKSISQIFYDKKLVNPEIFQVVRINRFGRVSLRCTKDHKIQVNFIVPKPPDLTWISDAPESCPECASDDNDQECWINDADLAERLQSLMTRRLLETGELGEDEFGERGEDEDKDDFGERGEDEFGEFGDLGEDDLGELGEDDGSDSVSGGMDFDSYVRKKASYVDRHTVDFDLDDAHAHKGCCAEVDFDFENYFADLHIGPEDGLESQPAVGQI